MIEMDMMTQSSLEADHLADCRSVHARLAEIAHARGALDASEAELLLAADELQIWRAYGQPTLAAYLEVTLGYGPHAGNERLRVARELGEHMVFDVTPATIAAFRAMRKQLDAECGERLTDDQLLQIVTRRALEPAAAADSPPACQVALMVCPSCKAATADGAGMIADVTPAQLDTAMCDAELLGNVEGEPERVRRTITPRLRRQVFARDHHRCTVPGCRSARNLDVHHIQFQSHGGSHEIWNITIQCSAHHALLHEGKLRVWGKAPDLVYERRTEEDDGWQRII